MFSPGAVEAKIPPPRPHFARRTRSYLPHQASRAGDGGADSGTRAAAVRESGPPPQYSSPGAGPTPASSAAGECGRRSSLKEGADVFRGPTGAGGDGQGSPAPGRKIASLRPGARWLIADPEILKGIALTNRVALRPGCGYTVGEES